MLAKDIMTRKLVLLKAEMTLKDAARTLSVSRVSGAPVVDAAGRLIGVLSQTDLVREMARREPRLLDLQLHAGTPAGEAAYEVGSPETTRVDEVMTPAVFSAEEDFAADHLGRMMLDKHMHRIIITKDGCPVGIVTPFDVLRCLLAR